MSREVVICLCLCFQLVLCQFGFFPSNERHQRQPQFGFNQNFFPRRISDTISSILHLNRNTPITNPDYMLPTRPENNFRPNLPNKVRFPKPEPVTENLNNEYNGQMNGNFNNPNEGKPTELELNKPDNVQPDFTVNPESNSPMKFEDFITNGNTPFGNNLPSNSGQNGDSSNINTPGQNGVNTESETKEPSFTSFITSDGSGVGISNSDLESNSGLIMGENSNGPVFGFNPTTDNILPVGEDTFTTKQSEEFGDRSGPGEVSSTTLRNLTPVPISVSRNNLNFGSAGIFSDTCTTVNGEDGTCIGIRGCAPLVKLLKQPVSSAAVQMLRRSTCGFEGNDPKVCCPLPGFPEAPPTQAPATKPPATQPPATQPPATQPPATQPPSPVTPQPTVPQPLQPSGKSGLDNDYLTDLPVPPECGVSNATLSRVVGGIDAKLGDFPWMALLGYKNRDTTRWLCGGSLISRHHVLTAAHCIHNHETDLYVIRVGELDLSREDDGATPVDVLIKSKIKHEKYDPTAFTDDIGLLILEKNLQFTDLIQPLCIPLEAELRARSFENYNPLIAGWGDTEFRGPSASHLQVLQLPVVTNAECKQAYTRYQKQVIDERVLCAGFKNGGKDACQGDSGGPLMQPVWNPKTYKTYFFQIGVVSFGRRCAEAGFPGVYTRITHYVPWLQKQMLGQ